MSTALELLGLVAVLIGLRYYDHLDHRWTRKERQDDRDDTRLND